jgi:hypothetical protein
MTLSKRDATVLSSPRSDRLLRGLGAAAFCSHAGASRTIPMATLRWPRGDLLLATRRTCSLSWLGGGGGRGEAGASTMFLETEAHNARVRRFYSRVGFVAENSVWMSRALSDPAR